MKVVIAIDSFKGCLTSQAAVHAAASGVRLVFPEAEIVELPIADGGEGTTEALVAATHGKLVQVAAHDPLMRPIKAVCGILGDGQTAVVEMAAAGGLTLLAPQERNPMKTTTFGTGEMILDLIRKGCRRMILGVGGSATNDGGMGMLQALGVRFLDGSGRILGQGGESLLSVEAADLSAMRPEVMDCHFDVLTDVRNPLYGPNGAACVFAKQKGASDAMIRALDEGLRHFSNIISRDLHRDIAQIPGAGAGGGLAAGCMAFLNTTIVSGIDRILQAVGFDEILLSADCVITGEGRMDRQTLQGKVPAGVARAAAKRGVPVYALAGQVESGLLFPGIKKVAVVSDPTLPAAVVMQPEYAKDHLTMAAAQLAREW